MNRRAQRQSRGIALILVVAAVGLATVLGYVMLSSAALQTRAGANQGRLTSADYLAESGLNIAMYYLQHPESAPGYPTFGGLGYWGGTGADMAIASGVDGTVNIAITRSASDNWTYEIVCTAKAGANADTKLTKTTGARVYVRNEYVVKHAAAFNGSTILVPHMTFTGDVWAAKNFAMRSTSPPPTVTGTIYRNALAPTGAGYQTLLTTQGCPTSDSPAPSSGANGLNKYATYSINEVTYSRSTITDGSLTGVTYSPTVSNPAGIFYKDATSGGDLQILDNVTINGTLVVDGNVRIRGANIVINAQSGYPGLIVSGNIEFDQPSKNLTVNGLAYIGGQMRTSTTTTPSPTSLISKFIINGALLTGTTGSTNIMTGYNIVTTVTYNAAKAKAPDLTANYRVPKGVSIVRWGLP